MVAAQHSGAAVALMKAPAEPPMGLVVPGATSETIASHAVLPDRGQLAEQLLLSGAALAPPPAPPPVTSHDVEEVVA